MENILFTPSKPLPLLTLQELAATKITTSLCNDQVLLNAIMDFKDVWQFKLNRYEKEWESVQSVASELFSKICKCVGLKKMILKFLWPVSYRMMLWKSKYAHSIENQYLRFYWKCRGRIDYKRMVRYIVKTKNVPIREKFRLACSLCLRKEIHELWMEMSDNDRIFFQKENTETMRPLLLFWIYTISTTRVKRKFVGKVLECAINLGFCEAVKYLLIKMKNDLRNDMALLCDDELNLKVKKNGFLEEGDIEVGYVLFSRLWYSNQAVVFNLNSALTLCLILHSSSREIFLKEFSDRLPFISLKVIRYLLYHIFLHYHLELRQDRDYYELLVDVWQMIPVSVKDSLLEDPYLEEKFLRVLIKREWQHLLIGVSEKSTPDDSPGLASITPYCFSEDRWDFLYFIIQEGIVTLPSVTEVFFVTFFEEKKFPGLLQKCLKICK